MDRVSPIIKDFTEIVRQQGKTTYTKRVVTETLDTYGRATADVNADTTGLSGLLRQVSSEDEELMDVGWVQIGDYRFFGFASDNWAEHDLIVDGSDIYEITHIFDTGITGDNETISNCICKKET